MADVNDPLVHLSSVTQALLEASAAIEAASLGVERDRAAKAASAPLSAPETPQQPGAPAA